MKGFINLIKPKGMSSAYAITAVKKKFNMPCGHMGTLDPMASGVLPVGIGKTSRLFQYLLDKQKTYIAHFKFGVLTDTLDTTGNIIERTKIIPTKEQIEKELSSFVGIIDQVPPKYSAKCIDGKRGYELARKGVEFTLPPKKVEILSYKMTKQILEDEFEFVIECRGGTYIRSLARDLGYKCNSLAVMSELTRTQSGIFNIENGVSVEDFKDSTDPEKYLIAPDNAVNYEKIILSNEQAIKILNGVFDTYPKNDGLYRIYNEDEFWGVGEIKEGVLKITAYVR